MDKFWNIAKRMSPFIGALIVAYVTNALTLNSQRQNNDYEKRQLAYSKLVSLKFPTQQLYVSRLQNEIMAEFYERSWRSHGEQKNSYEFQEAVYQIRQSETLTLKIIDNHKELFSCLGDIQILFKDTPELSKLVDNIYKLRSIKMIKPVNESADSLEKWKDSAIKDLQTLVDKEYGENIENLAKYLKNELKK